MDKFDPWAEFRKLSKDEQREQILQSCALSIDGAGVSLARKVEIFLEATPDEQQNRLKVIHEACKKRLKD